MFRGLFALNTARDLAMQRRNIWFIIAGLTSVWLFAGGTRADLPKVGRAHIRRVALAVAMLMVSHLFVAVCRPASGQEVAKDAKAALKERDRLADQVRKLQAAGKLAEAITTAEAMLAIERTVLPADHDDVIGSLNWLGELHADAEEFAAAKAAQQEALAILSKRYGNSYWKATDARLALEDVERRAGMTRERRKKLAEAAHLNEEVEVLYQARRISQAMNPARRALAMNKEMLGERHPQYATSLNNLAWLLESQGDRAAARPLYETALAIRKEVLGERHPHYAQSVENLAYLLNSQGDYAAAQPLYAKALAIRKELLGERHPDCVQSLENLAGVLGRVAHLSMEHQDFAAAKAAQQEALDVLSKGYGKSHWKVTDARMTLEDVERRAGMTPDQKQKWTNADRLNSEAFALYQANRFGEALESVRRAAALLKEVLGELHPAYATSLNNLASVLESQGDYAAARLLYEKALGIYKKVLGERHPAHATSLNSLAVLLSKQGDYAAARPLLEQAVAIYREVLAERHPAYATSLNNLAAVLESQGEDAAARPLLEQALAINKEVLGERDPVYATSLANLALLLASQVDYAGARPLLEQAVAINREVLGERHPGYATSLGNLALLLSKQGDYAAASPRLEQAVAINREVLGERHPAYATSLNNLGVLLQRQGDHAAARLLYEHALAIGKEELGERHPDHAAGLDNLAGLLASQGDYASARPLYEQALAIRKGVLGERHPAYTTSLNNLALLLASQGDYAAAAPLYEKALAINKAVQGERHPDYALNLSNLGALLHSQGDYARAAPLLKQALEITEGNLALAAAAQSERQQLAMALDLRDQLDAYLSLAPLAKLSLGDTYRYVLGSKGAVFERHRRQRAMRRRFQADSQSQAAQRFADYEQTVNQLATLALTTPDPKQAKVWREKLAGLARRKDELEAELARLDAGFSSEQAAAGRTPEQLQAALPLGTALVDLLVYTAFQPLAQGKGEFQTERRLVAFVVQRDRPIARIDLGPIAPIFKAIDDWRRILVAGKTAPTASDPAIALRRLIWDPVESHLDGIASVVVSPDGALGQVPLAALPGKEPNRYLIEERSMAVVPVPRMLGLAATSAAPR